MGGIEDKVFKDLKEEIAFLAIDNYLRLSKPKYLLAHDKMDIISDARIKVLNRINGLQQEKGKETPLHLIYLAALYYPIKEKHKAVWKKNISTDPVDISSPSPLNKYKIVVFSDRIQCPSYLTEKEREHTVALMYGDEIKLCEKLFGKFGELDRLILDYVDIEKKFATDLAPLIGKNTIVDVCKVAD
jgi:hypothetical protein